MSSWRTGILYSLTKVYKTVTDAFASFEPILSVISVTILSWKYSPSMTSDFSMNTFESNRFRILIKKPYSSTGRGTDFNYCHWNFSTKISRWAERWFQVETSSFCRVLGDSLGALFERELSSYFQTFLT